MLDHEPARGCTRRCEITAIDSNSVKLSFQDSKANKESMIFSLDEFTDFIRCLGLVRQQMTERSPSGPIVGTRVHFVHNAKWNLHYNMQRCGSGLAFYHPAYGPVGIIFNKEDIPQIMKALNAHLSIYEAHHKQAN